MELQFRSIALSLCLVIGLLAFCVARAESDVCLGPLNSDLKAKHIDTGHGSVESATKSWFCSNDFESTYRKSSGKLTIAIPIADVPIEFGGGAKFESSWQKRIQFCSSRDASFNSAQMHFIYSEVTDPAAYQAFVQCRKSLPQLLTLSAPSGSEEDEFNIVGNLTAVGVMSKARVTSVALVGVKCATLKKDAVILPGGTAFSCHRTTKRAVSIAVNTNAGSATLDLPPTEIDNLDRAIGSGNLHVYNDVVNVSGDYTDIGDEEDTWDVDKDHGHVTNLRISVDPAQYNLSHVTYGCTELVGGGACGTHYFRDLQASPYKASVSVWNDGTRAHVYLRGHRHAKSIVSTDTPGSNIELYYDKTILLVVPASASGAIFRGSISSGQFAFDPAEPLPSGIVSDTFKLQATQRTHGDVYYTFLVRRPGSNPNTSTYPTAAAKAEVFAREFSINGNAILAAREALKKGTCEGHWNPGCANFAPLLESIKSQVPVQDSDPGQSK